MKRGFRTVIPVCAALLVLIAAAAMANNAPATVSGMPSAAQLVGPLEVTPAIPTGMVARRTGSKVHLTWVSSGHNTKAFYLFHFTTIPTPPADFKGGGWYNDLIVDGTARQADLTVGVATKPNVNYYLICPGSSVGAYVCSSVFAESLNMIPMQPIIQQH